VAPPRRLTGTRASSRLLQTQNEAEMRRVRPGPSSVNSDQSREMSGSQHCSFVARLLLRRLPQLQRESSAKLDWSRIDQSEYEHNK
jgi:hypothetical protein